MANYLLCKIIQPSGFLSHMQDNFLAPGAPMSQPNDPVATILQQWRRERPDLDVTPMGPVGRLRRSAVQVQKRGLIQRQINPADARSVLVQLSAEGLALIDAAVAEHVQNLHSLVNGLSAEEAAQLDQLLGKWMEALENSAK